MKTVMDYARRLLSGRAQAYRNTFDNPEGQKVLRDLANFCRATEPTFEADARAHALLEGRREVWLRIQRHLNMNERDLWDYHKVGDDHEWM